jgi:hypothetical protein
MNMVVQDKDVHSSFGTGNQLEPKLAQPNTRNSFCCYDQ